MNKDIYKTRDVRDFFLQSLNECMTMVVYDCETTGLSPVANHIIQLYARKCFVCADGLEEAESRNWYINPGYALPEKIVKLTGVTDDFLADKPSECEVVFEIIDFFGSEPVVGYNNIKFDDKFMTQLFERYGASYAPEVSVDLYAVVKDIIDPGETENKKLLTITKYFGLEDEISQFHNAEGDTLATMLCLNKCVNLCRTKKNEACQNQIMCTVKSISPWTNPNNWRQQRIYVETNSVTLWFDVLNRTWNLNSKTDHIARYNIENVIEQVFSLTDSQDEDAFSKLDRKITNPWYATET